MPLAVPVRSGLPQHETVGVSMVPLHEQHSMQPTFTGRASGTRSIFFRLKGEDNVAVGNAHGMGSAHIRCAPKGHDNLERLFVWPFQGMLLDRARIPWAMPTATFFGRFAARGGPYRADCFTYPDFPGLRPGLVEPARQAGRVRPKNYPRRLTPEGSPTCVWVGQKGPLG